MEKWKIEKFRGTSCHSQPAFDLPLLMWWCYCSLLLLSCMEVHWLSQLHIQIMQNVVKVPSASRVSSSGRCRKPRF